MTLKAKAFESEPNLSKIKPTLEELEAILNAGEEVPIQILPNGEVRERPYKMGCKLTGTGRGDCSHFTGLPKSFKYPKDVDEYGIPHGWCDYCWLVEKFEALHKKVRTCVD